MSYAQVTRGRKTRGFITQSLQSKADLELGRKLSPEELTKLSERFSLETVFNSCEKVYYENKFIGISWYFFFI